MGAQQQSLKNKQRKAHLAQVAQHKKSLSLSLSLGTVIVTL